METVLWKRVRGGGLGARILSAYIAMVLAVAVIGPGVTVYAAEGDTIETTATPVAEGSLPDDEVVIDDPLVEEIVDPVEEVAGDAVDEPVDPDASVDAEAATLDEPEPSLEVTAMTVSPAPEVVAVTAIVAGDSTNLTLAFEGVRKSSGWITGNLQEWGEGELIPYRVVITNKDDTNSVTVPALSITMDHYVSTKNAIMYDYTTAWGYYITGTQPALGDTWYPATTPLTPLAQDDPIDPPVYGTASLLKTSFAADVIVIPPGEYAVVYFQAHLARTPVWNVADPARDGAGYVQGSAGHGQLDMPGVGAKTVPTPSVPVPSGAIAVYKYFDGNENDSWDEGEDMLSGWEFTLRDSLGAVVATAITDANGLATFPDLSLGTYDVTETLQAGWDCTGLLTRSVEVFDRTTSEAWFGNVSDRGDLTVYKYLDNNENDAFDPGEQMLSGWEFELWAEGSCVATCATDAAGEYTWTDLPAGTYEIREVLQAGWDCTGLIAREAVVPDDGSVSVWFGNVPDRGNVTVYKFHDRNMNGVYDDGEEMLEDWLFEIWDSTPSFVASGTTDANGAFKIEELAPGTYTAHETLQGGWDNTTPLMQEFTVSDDTTATVWFGNVELGDLVIYKYLDANENGVYDAGEAMLEDWEFTVTQETPPLTPSLAAVWLVGSGFTDANGELEFEDLVPGEYVVRETLQSDWHTTGSTEATVQVMPGEVAELWFGNAPDRGDLVVYKYLDANEDGVYDVGEEMLEGWEFTLSDGESLTMTATTDASGMLQFSDLLVGDYTVVETLREGWVNTSGLEQTATVTVGETTELYFGNIEEYLPYTELDLAITKKASVYYADPGDLVTYTLTWENLGNEPAENYTIVDDYDERYVTIEDANGGTVDAVNGTITWTFAGPLAMEDGKQTLTYTVRISADMPDATTNVDNVVVISHPDDVDLSNNTDDERVVVEPYLPFTGGEYLLLFGFALLAILGGTALRLRAVRVE